MPDLVADFLGKHGPSRSSRIARWLQDSHNISAEAARKRISRVRPPVRSFPIPLLPKREDFLYLQDQRSTELLWTRFLQDLRETKSVYAAALDAIIARGGVVATEDFAVNSGAPLAMRGQVSADRVANQLCSAGVLDQANYINCGDCYSLKRHEIGSCDFDGYRGRRLAERIALEGLRDWLRTTGMAGYNSVAIRGDERPRRIGAFSFDLTAASYLLPLRRQSGQPGFIAADVFVEGRLDENHIQYVVRKAQLLKASQAASETLTILVAPEFTGRALTVGHAAGIMLTPLTTLFGQRAGAAITELVATLKNAAAIAAANPGKLVQLIDDLSEIEGAASNLRGILFELIVFHLVRINAISADLGVTARNPQSFESADIDVFGYENRGSCVAIECKGKNPGGVVELDEIERWLGKIPTFQAHHSNHPQLREAALRFEIWTSGTFSAEALEKLAFEQKRRTRRPIGWKDGAAVADIARGAKEKAILKALQEHFLRHPLATVANERAA